MEIVNLIAGQTSVSNKELETAVHKLLFVFEGASDGTDVAGILADLVGDAEMTLTKQDGNGNVPLHPQLLIRDLGEISTFETGAITIETTSPGNYRVSFTVDITEGGALKLNDRAKLLFNLKSKPAASVLSIDALDDFSYTSSYIKYDKKFVNANTRKDFVLKPNQDYMAAIQLDKIKEIGLFYPISRKTVRYSQREIKQLLLDRSWSVVDNDGAMVLGVFNLALLDLRGVHTLGQVRKPAIGEGFRTSSLPL